MPRIRRRRHRAVTVTAPRPSEPRIAVLILTGSIPVIDAETGEEVSRGVVPDWCVVVSATRAATFPGGEFGMPCVLVIKRLTEGERHDKAKLNDILRDHGVAT